MDSTVSRCLSREELDAIADGSAVSGAAAAHLARCRACAEVVESARFARRFGAVLSGDVSVGLSAGVDVHGGAEGCGRFPEALGYRFLDVVGSGGQGVIYRAEQTATGQTVAIKVLHGGRAGSGGSGVSMARARFAREIQIAASLQHSGIVRVLDSIILGDGRDAIIMEWIDGIPMDDWADRFRAGNRFEESRLVRLIAEVADAVAYAHLRGVIHRDLKPSNVIVDAGGRAHVLDFGVAWRREDAGLTGVDRLTIAGEFTGTLAFAAPEQVNGEGLMPDTRTDVYALGMIGYRVLTGVLPYEVDRSLESAVRNIMYADVPARPTSRMSGDLWVVLSKAMSKDAARRYQSAAEFAADLRRVADGLAVLARGDSRLYVLRKAARRHRVAIGFGLTVLAGLVGMLVVLFVGNADLAEALRESRLQQLRAHTAVGARDRAEEILWSEIARAVPASADVSRGLWEWPAERRELLWSFVEMQAEATCVDIVRPFSEGVRSIERLRDGRFGLVSSNRRAAWMTIAGDRASITPGPSLPEATELGRFSPDGRYLLTREPGRVCCIDAMTGEILGESSIGTIGFEIASEQMSDWGAVLCSRDSVFSLVSLPGLEEMARFEGGPMEQRPRIHPTQRRLIFIDGAGDVVRLDLDDDERVGLVRGAELGWEHGPRLAQVLATDDGSTIAVTHIDGITVARPSGDGGVVRLVRIKPGSRVSASLSGDGRLLAAQAFGDSTLRLWDTDTGRELPGLHGHRGAVLVHAISYDGSRMVTADHEGMLRVWCAPGHGWRRAYGLPTSRTHQFAILDDGATLLASDSKGRIVRHRLDGPADEPAARWTMRDEHGGLLEVVRVACAGGSSAGAGVVAAAGVSDRVAFVDVLGDGGLAGSGTGSTSEPAWVSVGRGEAVTGLVFVPGGSGGVHRLLVCTHRGGLFAFDGSAGGTFVETVRGGVEGSAHASEICCAADGSMAAVTYRDGRVVLLDPATLRVIREVRASSSQLRSAAFSPDGRTLAAVGDSGELILIDTRSGAVRRSAREVEDSLFAVAFHPSGRTVAVGDRAGRVMMFDVPSLSAVGTLRADGAVMSLGFTKGGGSLVVSALDSPVERWDFDAVASTFAALRAGSAGK